MCNRTIALPEEGKIRTAPQDCMGFQSLSRREMIRGAAGFIGAALLTETGCASGSSNGIPPSTTIFDQGSLTNGYDLGLNTSEGRTDWLSHTPDGALRLDYPAGQKFGSVFIAVDAPTTDISERQTFDYSPYTSLVVEIKGRSGGETVSIGLKSKTDPDNGREPTYAINNLTTAWQAYDIPMASFVSMPSYPASRLKIVYIACEFTFVTGVAAETLFVRSIRLRA